MPGPPVAVLRTRDDDDPGLRTTPVPTAVDRFALIEQVGRGGMGVVYAAWDPRLDRKIAIKLVDDRRFADTDVARVRLEQEARAAATLNHPNIVTIYDVGVHDGRVFLAMEFVQGCTLGAWLRGASRPWHEVVAMFVQVGRGLAAAHAAGLVHRDFKPDNVLVDTDPGGGPGRPRVADFGLASSRASRCDPLVTTAGGVGRSCEPGGTPVAGTPAYMAPEQFDGLDIGPAADQFAFCVALFEGLFGHRPFAGSSYEALSIAVHGNEPEIPRDHGVPAGVIELVLRGLEVEPAARHRSVEALLVGLERVLHRRRRAAVAAAAIAVGAVALLAGFRVAQAVTPQPCERAGDRLASWADDDRQAVRAALGDAGDPVVAALDHHADGIAQRRREVCEATHVHGEQSDQVLQLRMACLARVAGRFEGLTDELARVGGRAAVDPEAIAARLPELAMCDDVETLSRLTNRHATRSSRSSTEQDRAWAQGVELVERALTRRMLGADDAREPAEQAVELARDHDLPGVQARALSVLADLELEAGRATSAESLRREAVRLGVMDGQGGAAVHLILDQADAALVDERLDEATLHMDYFETFMGALDDADVRDGLTWRAEIVRGRLALGRGDATEAERRLVAIPTTALSALDKRALWMALGAAQRALGHGRAAAATWTRLLGLVESLRGEWHTDVAAVLNNLALLALDEGDTIGADTLLTRAESIANTSARAREPLLAAIATNRGWSARLAGRHDDARVQLDRALALGRATHGDDHPSLAYAHDQLGELERGLGHLDAALDHFAAAGALRDASLGADHPETITSLVGVARIALARGEGPRARSAVEAALRIVEAHPQAAHHRAALLELQRDAVRSIAAAP